jgi:uncharacterized membrane protein
METTPKSAEIKNETTDKTMGIVAYITVFGLIAAIIMNKEPKNSFASYHIRQSLGLCVSGIALFVIGLIPILGWLISILGTIFIVFLWLFGFINALNGNEKPIPLLGEKYAEWFKNVQ